MSTPSPDGTRGRSDPGEGATFSGGPGEGDPRAPTGQDPDRGLIGSQSGAQAPDAALNWALPSAQVQDEAESQSEEEDDGEEDSEPTTNTSGGSFTLKPPSHRNPQGVILSTPFAPTYRSTFILEPHGQRLLPLLKHLNCGYLSTPGLAPTLTELKQHAQSLTILIKHLSISTRPGIIDNRHGGIDADLGFVEGETYDWLNDLGREYLGPENPALAARHEMPLNSVLNTLQHYDVENPIPGGPPLVGVRDRCPLHHSEKAPVNGPSLPYATHQALISHANEVLELLDHEYSATGGLLSILPPKEEKADREKAETTLLGQMILYIQRLVERLHALERLYANTLDILASESLVPSQALSRLGPSGRKGRELVYPQDRFVLVNAGEDVWNFLDRKFEQKEKTDEKVEEMYRGYGVVGEGIWEQRGGREMARGITAIDVTTRYFRLRKDLLKTIFVIPAHQIHPGVKATREMEKLPTVVSVVKPVWPERASMWEMKHRSDLNDLKQMRRENAVMLQKFEYLEEEKKVLLYDNKLKDGEVRDLKGKVKIMENIVMKDGDIDAERLKVWEHVTSIDAQRQEAHALLDTARLEKAEAEKVKGETEKERREFEVERSRFMSERMERDGRDKEEMDKHFDRLAGVDKGNAEAAVELEAKLKEVWRRQIVQTQVVMEWLKKRKIDYETDVIPQDIAEAGERAGNELFESIFGLDDEEVS